MTYKILSSPLSTDVMTQGMDSFSTVRIYNKRLYYAKKLTSEQGRVTIISCDLDGDNKTEELPYPHSAKTRINVYGGACFCPTPHGVVFCDGDSKRLSIAVNGKVECLAHKQANYADIQYCSHSDSIVYVVETLCEHGYQSIEQFNFTDALIEVIATGADFYHAPQKFKNKFAWLEWDKSDMPWDNSTIMERTGGNQAQAIATNAGHFQPNYDKEGTLHYVSDKTGYFNIYKAEKSIAPMDRDFAYPLWVYGMRTYDFMNSSIIACSVQNGEWQIGFFTDNTFTSYECDAVTIESLSSEHNTFAFVGGFTDRMPEIICVQDGVYHTIDSVGGCPLPMDYISYGQSISYAGGGGTVQAYYYAPTHPKYRENERNLPPLIVKSHGGPTGQTDNSFSQKIQFWTSRGFAVLDVNYSGSTGFGSIYRNRLNGQWGILDVSDLELGAMYLVNRGLVNKDKLIISGSSAGGFSVLSALTFGDTFKAGCSIYGIGDLVGLAQETHKFESHYFDTLIAPYEKNKGEYIKRSPINYTDKLNVPVLFLQGLDDVVVPPSQSQAMYDALRDKGIDTALLLFQGEGHGFSVPKTVATALLAELDFYAQVLDLSHNESFSLTINKDEILNFV